MDIKKSKVLASNFHIVLFTGGLDSAYRLCQLALEEDTIVQPVYISFPDDGHRHFRPEIVKEIEAQDKILEYIQSCSQTKATFLPIKRIHRDEIPPNDFIMMYEDKLGEYGLGWQYLYIARYAMFYPNVELCLESYEFFLKKKNIQFYTDNSGHVKMDIAEFNQRNVKADTLELLFKDISFSIMGTTRKVIINNLKLWGYDEILNLIAFCYKTIDGFPCGICDNCVKKIEEGLVFLFRKDSLHRYYVLKVLRKINKDLSFLYYYYIFYGEKNFLSLTFNYKGFFILRFFKHISSLNDKKLIGIINNRFSIHKLLKSSPDLAYCENIRLREVKKNG